MWLLTLSQGTSAADPAVISQVLERELVSQSMMRRDDVSSRLVVLFRFAKRAAGNLDVIAARIFTVRVGIPIRRMLGTEHESIASALLAKSRYIFNVKHQFHCNLAGF